MGKIEGIQIKNFGPLHSITLGKTRTNQNIKALGNLVAIIGPSGNGKSTLSDAFGFIADCLEYGVERACDSNNRGGFEQIRSQGINEPISFELYYRETSNSRPITYELKIDVDNDGRPYVLEERLRQRVNKRGWPRSFLYLYKGVGFVFEGNEKENSGLDDDGNIIGQKTDVELSDYRNLGIVTLGAMKKYERVEKFLSFLKSWYLCYFSPNAARKIETAAPQPYLNMDGSNINNVAQYMYRENSKEFEKVLKDIQSKLPNIQKIMPKKFDNGQMMLQFYEKGFESPFYSSKMSDGTLKLFAYYLLMHESSPRQLIFIEEPENGIYHQYLTDLAREMKKSAGNGFSKQLFITTHSPFFVNALSPDDVWVLSKGEDGFSSLTRASDFELVTEMSQEEVLLGDLWYSNYFG